MKFLFVVVIGLLSGIGCVIVLSLVIVGYDLLIYGCCNCDGVDEMKWEIEVNGVWVEVVMVDFLFVVG